MSRIQEWHGGKIILVWIAAVAAALGLYVAGEVIIEDVNSSNTFGYILLGVLGGAAGFLIAAFAVTWKWFGGKE